MDRFHGILYCSIFTRIFYGLNNVAARGSKP